MAVRKTIDVSSPSEIRRLAEEVAESGEQTLLTVEGEPIAILSPAGQPILLPAEDTPEALAAFLSSYGGWKGLIDITAFKRASRRSRSIIKPAPSL